VFGRAGRLLLAVVAVGLLILLPVSHSGTGESSYGGLVAWQSPWSDPSIMVADGRMIWVVNGLPALVEVDSDTGRTVRVISQVHGNVFAPNDLVIVGHEMWVTMGSDDATWVPSDPVGLAEFSTSSGQLTRFISAATLGLQDPSSVVVAAGSLWVLDSGGNYPQPTPLIQVSEENGRIVHRWRRVACNTQTSESLATNGRWVWAPSCSGGVARINAQTDTVAPVSLPRTTPDVAAFPGLELTSFLYTAGHLWFVTPWGTIFETDPSGARVVRSWTIPSAEQISVGFMSRMGGEILVDGTPAGNGTTESVEVSIASGRLVVLSPWLARQVRDADWTINVRGHTWVSGFAGDGSTGWVDELDVSHHRVARTLANPAYNFSDPSKFWDSPAVADVQVNDGRDVWVPDSLGGFTEFDGESGRIVRHLDSASYGFDYLNTAVVCDGRLWVSDDGPAGGLTVVNSRSGSIVAKWTSPHNALSEGWPIACTGTTVWIATSTSVSEVGATSLHVYRTMSDAREPYEIASPVAAVTTSGQLWVLNDPTSGPGTVTVISLRTARLSDVITLPFPHGRSDNYPGAVLAVGDEVWISNADGGYVILSARTGDLLGGIRRLPRGSEGIGQMVQVGDDVWMSSANGQPVYAVNIVTRHFVHLSPQFDVVNTAISVNAVGDDLWVLGYVGDGTADIEINLLTRSTVQVLQN
jgi:hypothetical protein